VSCEEYTVYVVDPDETVHDALATLLGDGDRRVSCYLSAENFLDSSGVSECQCGCVLAEANLPGMGSLAFLRLLRHQGIELPIVVLASTSNRDIADQALRAGAAEVIEKPLVGDRLLELLSGLSTDTNEFVTANQ